MTIYIRNVVLNFIGWAQRFAFVLLVPRWIALGAGWVGRQYPPNFGFASL